MYSAISLISGSYSVSPVDGGTADLKEAMVEKDEVNTLDFDCEIWGAKEGLVEEVRKVDAGLAARRQRNKVRGVRQASC
jgi:hypothetical protein